jgi:hypothetical protein
MPTLSGSSIVWNELEIHRTTGELLPHINGDMIFIMDRQWHDESHVHIPSPKAPA